MTTNSYRQILRSSSLLGLSSAVTVLIGIARTKAAAVLVGAEGLGQVGIYGAVVAVVVGIFGLGLGQIGTRQVAEAAAEDSTTQLAAARRALLIGGLVLASLAGVSVWALREPIARLVFDETNQSTQVGWLAVGAALTILATSQNAVLNGLRRIRSLAAVRALASGVAAIGGVLALWWFRQQGLVAYVLFEPAAAFVLGALFLRRLQRPSSPPAWSDVRLQARPLLVLGSALMLGSLVYPVGQLALRAIVHRMAGDDAVGFYHAGSALSTTYITFILSAMGTDFFPRLTAVASDSTAAVRLVNQQTEVALALTAPLFVAAIGLAPWIIAALYTPHFHPATDVARWQILGDTLKIVSWPLGYITLAKGAGRLFVGTEILATCTLISVTTVLLPRVGVMATGIGYAAMYLVYGATVYLIGRRLIHFRWTDVVRKLLAVSVGCSILAFSVAYVQTFAGAALAIVLATALAWYGLRHVAQAADLHSFRPAERVRRLIDRLSGRT